ncbi:MAG: YHS domain-containing (seleno)protein [Pseudomonadota bacterium]
MTKLVRFFIAAIFAGTALGAAPAVAEGPKPEVFQTEEGVAIRGYDPVAYFKAGEPVKGDPAYSTEHLGATWLFASADNRDAFVAAPETYMPAYGGYCAYGMALGGKVPIDPAAWKIVDGTLYLNVNPKVQGWWEEDTAGYIAKADEVWPEIRNQ